MPTPIETKVYNEIIECSYSSPVEVCVASLMQQDVVYLSDITTTATLDIQREINILTTKLEVRKEEIKSAHNCIVHMIKREAA